MQIVKSPLCPSVQSARPQSVRQTHLARDLQCAMVGKVEELEL